MAAERHPPVQFSFQSPEEDPISPFLGSHDEPLSGGFGRIDSVGLMWCRQNFPSHGTLRDWNEALVAHFLSMDADRLLTSRWCGNPR